MGEANKLNGLILSGRDVLTCCSVFVCKGVQLEDLPVVVRCERVRRHLALLDVEAETGISASTVCRLENGHPLRADSLQVIVDWLGIPVIVFPSRADD